MSDILNLTKITSLALADSVNPCAIAVLTMVLIAILSHNPKKRKQVLYGGLAFVSAVFLMYLFYGFIIIQAINSFTTQIMRISPYLYDGFAVLLMIIGALNIKDFFSYRAGSFATEMPIWMRPKVKKIISKI